MTTSSLVVANKNKLNEEKAERCNSINRLKCRWEFFSKLLKVRHEPHKSYVAMKFWKKCKWIALSLSLYQLCAERDDGWLEKEANSLPIMQLAFDCVCNVDDEKMNSKNADLYHVYVIRCSFTYLLNFQTLFRLTMISLRSRRRENKKKKIKYTSDNIANYSHWECHDAWRSLVGFRGWLNERIT